MGAWRPRTAQLVADDNICNIIHRKAIKYCIIMRKAVQATNTRSAAEADYLNLVGARVRRIRAQRGMSRRTLAAASGVSERYLAQLESGQGNASLMVLKAIADAMHVPVDDLVDERDEVGVDYLLLRERLRQASTDELAHLKALCERRDEKTRPRRPVALVGLRGAGKSTLGAALAKRLGVPFVELGQEIEREAGTSISEILARGGQSAYRRFERAALAASLERFDAAVIATGGSLVSEPRTYEQLLAACVTVWLRAAPHDHMARVIAQGDMRPMARHRDAMADLKRMLDERETLYARADYTLDTSGNDVDAALGALLDIDAIRDLDTKA